METDSTRMCELLVGLPDLNVNSVGRLAGRAKEVVRSIYAIDDAELAVEFVTQLGIDLQDQSCPSRSPGSTSHGPQPLVAPSA